MRILQVSTFDIGGGAEKVAWNLFKGYQASGHHSWLMVGFKKSEDSDVVLIPNQWNRALWFNRVYIGKFLQSFRGAGRIAQMLYNLCHPQCYVHSLFGLEDFNFPLSRKLMHLVSEAPDIIQCHNLHGGYFDLRVLSKVSRKVPVVLTLHDSWLLTGHCAHTFNCERWRNGCGECPDLNIYPAIRRDGTAFNWKRKQKIFSQSKLYVASPSHWILERMKESIVAQSVVESRVIPNGVDLSLFHPSDKRGVRLQLGIQPNINVLLFSANGIHNNPWKDFKTIRNSIKKIANYFVEKRILFIALGEEGETENFGRVEIRFVPHQKETNIVSRYFQSADIYLHAAKVDTFPNTILEALACGTPVIATNVGGISEQIKSLKMDDIEQKGIGFHFFDKTDATGILVSEGDSEGISRALMKLLNDNNLRNRLSENAYRDAMIRFDQKKQTDVYLEWYKSILSRK